MNKNKTTKRNNRKEANQSKSFQITNDFVCLDVHMNSYDKKIRGYIMYMTNMPWKDSWFRDMQ